MILFIWERALTGADVVHLFIKIESEASKGGGCNRTENVILPEGEQFDSIVSSII